jgi:hypothetical protein
MPTVQPRITALRPLWGVEGGRVAILGDGFDIDPALPPVTIGDAPARLAHASTRALSVIVPTGAGGGRRPVRVGGVSGETPLLEVAAPLATGLHQVDSPAFDADGNLFVTFSGSRGQQGPVSVYVVRRDGVREPFVSELPNPTSLAFDRRGVLHVSSRFEGRVYRVAANGRFELLAADLGVPCGIAFGPGGDLFVGDRSGSILRMVDGRATEFATLPASIAAFHLAFGPDDRLYVSAPTLSSCESLYRVDPDGVVEPYGPAFGRPQGLAFDDRGRLYVADSLAGGGGGLFRVDPDHPEESELLAAVPGLVGVAFDPSGGLVLASADTVYRLDVPLRGRLPPAAPSRA